MKILLIHKYYYLKGGAERCLFNLKRLLEVKGHTVEVFAMQHPQNQSATYARYFVPYVDFHNLGSLDYLSAALRVIWSPSAAKRIAHVLDEFRPDIVHLHNIYHQLSPSILIPIARRGIPIVQTLHDYKLLCPNYLLYTEGAPCMRCRNRNYFQAVRHRCLHGSWTWSLLAAIEMALHKAWRVYERYVATFITPSAFMKTMAQTFGVPSSQLYHIPNFLFVEDFTVSEADGGYFAYIGRLSHEKGLTTLIGALRKIPRVQLLVVGGGSMRPILEQMVEAWGLTNVRFTGYLTGDRLSHVLAGARFTVLPSKCYEVSPQSILESFAVGKPVVAARIGGIPELVDPDANADGLLFNSGVEDELAACLSHLWDHPEKAREMGLNGRRKVEALYDAETHYTQLLPLYERWVKS